MKEILFLCMLLVQPLYTAVIITECNLSVSGGQTAWVEIYNSGTETVNLNGWGISDLSGTDTAFAVEELSLDPLMYAVIHFRAETSSGIYKTPQDAFFSGTGNRRYLNLFTTDTIPHLDNDFCFLVLTRTPGSPETSLQGAADAVVLYADTGEVSSYRIELLVKTMESGMWHIPEQTAETVHSLTNYTSSLPLVNLSRVQSAVRKKHKGLYIDTDSHTDWTPAHSIHTSPGTSVPLTEASLNLSKSCIRAGEEPLAITVQCPSLSTVRISLYAINGFLLHTICNNTVLTPFFSVTWDGKTENSPLKKTGLYIILCTVINQNTGLVQHISKPVTIIRGLP